MSSESKRGFVFGDKKKSNPDAKRSAQTDAFLRNTALPLQFERSAVPSSGGAYQVITNGLNSLNTVRILDDISANFFINNGFAGELTQGCTLAMVCKFDSSGGGNGAYFVTSITAGGQERFGIERPAAGTMRVTTNRTDTAGNQKNPQATGITEDVFQIVVLRVDWSGASATLRVAETVKTLTGDAIQTGTSPSTSSLQTALSLAPSTGRSTMEFGDILFYNRALTDTEILLAEAFLSNKWGL